MVDDPRLEPTPRRALERKPGPRDRRRDPIGSSWICARIRWNGLGWREIPSSRLKSPLLHRGVYWKATLLLEFKLTDSNVYAPHSTLIEAAPRGRPHASPTRLPYPGKLIAVEGLDGSGKSTQIYLLKRWLELQNMKVSFTEWNSSTIVKDATKRGKKDQLLTPTTFCLIHCTDFAHRYERYIVPLLRQGYIVLADRYIFTALARDAVRGCDRSWIRNLYDFAILPDITFYFDVPLATAIGRILSGRPVLKYHEAGMDLGLSTDLYESFQLFQGRIKEEYSRLADEYHFTVVDASRPIEAQQQLVRSIVADRIDLAHFVRRGRIGV